MDNRIPKKAYILNLQFGIKQWRVWFIGDASKDTEWRVALKELDDIGDTCNNPDEFYERAIQHFKNAEFVPVKD